MACYHGNPVSRGIVIGNVLLYKPYTPQVGGRQYADAIVERKTFYHTVVSAAQQELEQLAGKLQTDFPDKAAILMAQRALLTDVVLEEEILYLLSREQPDVAIDTVYRKYAATMSELEDELLRERSMDFLDLNTRLLRICEGGRNVDLSRLESPAIIVTTDLLPSDTAGLDRKHTLGILAETGGENSHSAIIARSYGIPAILNVENITSFLSDGEQIVLDALDAKRGCVYTGLDETALDAYRRTAAQYAERLEQTRNYLGRDAITKDGTRVEILLNLSSGSNEELAYAEYADGVGLFRTEFLYMHAGKPPSEEEQYAVYSRVLRAFGGKPVILRTMDIGGDKELPYLSLPTEQNPFLGNRALRLSFSRPDLFHTQLRAALRAAKNGNIWIMFPMVTCMEDIDRAKQFVQKAHDELLKQGQTIACYKLGAMIEVPSIALLSTQLAQEVDFASIGTNDLCQYLTAADRMNPDVARYYQSYHPALLQVLGQIADAFNAAGKPLGICGELGGDQKATELLIGLGFRKLSMGVEALAAVKRTVCNLESKTAQRVAQTALRLRTADEILDYLLMKRG
ncbi:MAG: phosphoenolpyruvate--protein phosphotransferase [Clostridiales bacterium]|jgi:phosphotransferase system enzyme I (PtsI)|nr:phosphoenolpyruvate--protein phosphotransferase [Clostridiales bacterium]